MNSAEFKNFEEAGQAVLKFLYQKFGFNLWMITRTEGDDWIVLQSEDNGYNVQPGQVFRWADSFCSHMVQGKAPRIAPRSEDIPLYVNAPIAKQVEIKAYIGQPLTKEDGSLFGTLCAIDPKPQSEAITKEAGLIDLLGQMLSYILQGELREVEQIRQRERFKEEALNDSLTGLFNRRAWDNLIGLEEERCKRYGHPTAILMIDLNNLKTVNDSLGHTAGDELIQKAATALKGCVRSNDIVARLGGDEFAILSIENNQVNAENLVNRVLQVFAEANISAAIGLAMRNPLNGLLKALQEADEKMYAHKKKIKS
ncbi:MAG: sensor domain-containing diguanylate cyclase [Acinetobacter bohemicus]|jgi:diguanylate cyclase (GGDEF)-like protein|uniref:diguanylate cyclase n=1 Tax=Acinetobacter bohemicus TaxID=1435036 RepID=A0A1I6VX82_9GAMM|nr:sensor domain-containing diguanylate cyclase [Acinetobacter bohemicus]KAB0650841.1 sensor domain-containing diguanylate cyclase [Acinetobacter bohemicus]SFT18299.1 diguanylate cyclase (GGDEF) domain-containing protein [Acinetobacter bohemicus]